MFEDQPRASINSNTPESTIKKYELAKPELKPKTTIRMGDHGLWLAGLAAYLYDGSIDNPNVVLGSE